MRRAVCALIGRVWLISPYPVISHNNAQQNHSGLRFIAQQSSNACLCLPHLPLLPVWMRWMMFSVCFVLELSSSKKKRIQQQQQQQQLWVFQGKQRCCQPSLQPAGCADVEGGKGDRVWGMLHGCPQFSGLSQKNKHLLSAVLSGGWRFRRGHLRGRHAAVRRTRSRAEWLTAASEVPSFPPFNHWEAGWRGRERERERERGRGKERENKAAGVRCTVAPSVWWCSYRAGREEKQTSCLRISSIKIEKIEKIGY